MNRYVISKKVNISRLISFNLCLLFSSCLEDNFQNTENSNEIENSNKNKVLELKKELELLRWENARLSLKLRSVDGAALVRDVQTNLWHFDVERTPYTGNATENFKMENLVQKLPSLKGKEMVYSVTGIIVACLNPKVSGSTVKRMVCSVNGMKRASCLRQLDISQENSLKFSKIDPKRIRRPG